MKPAEALKNARIRDALMLGFVHAHDARGHERAITIRADFHQALCAACGTIATWDATEFVEEKVPALTDG